MSERIYYMNYIDEDFDEEDLDVDLESVRAAIAYMSELSQVSHPFRHDIISALKDKEMRIERILKEHRIYKKLALDDASVCQALKNLILRLAASAIKE